MLYPAGKKSVRVRIRRTHTSCRRYYFEIVPLSPAKRWEQDYQRVCEFLPLAYGRRLATTLALILDRSEYDYEVDFVE